MSHPSTQPTHRHTWHRACDMVPLVPPLPGVPHKALLVRACTPCGLVEVWHGNSIPGGMQLATWEHWEPVPISRMFNEVQITWDRTKEG